ncbi:MAG: hypothetical protein OIN87_08825 [Candidatus Methanoperedens sp.]|nr:hypothetical protein [Candidatus Methanoperedens sp.]
MNKKISDNQPKRPELMKTAGKKGIQAIETWMIEEYYVPFQAS